MPSFKVYYGIYIPLAYSSFVFSGGEIQVKLEDRGISGGIFTIEGNLWSSNDIMELLLLTDAIKRRYKPNAIELVCPYFPYARQDRVCDKGEALSVKVIADIINLQKYSKVTIWDAHSDVTPALIDRCENISCTEFVRTVVRNLDKKPILVAPDGGARKKVFECAKELGCGFVQAEKLRNVHTGEITGTEVTIPVNYDGNNFLIVDDICDGGRTFIELAKELRTYDVGNVYLYVTHGIFSKGLGVLDMFDRIFCPNVKDKNINVMRRDYEVLR
jgi:ribose-phosphate pyrophosphokinase